MLRISTVTGMVVGVAAILVVYIAFVAHEFITAGHSGRAVGLGVFVVVIGQPLFLISAALAFALAFLRVVR